MYHTDTGHPGGTEEVDGEKSSMGAASEEKCSLVFKLPFSRHDHSSQGASYAGSCNAACLHFPIRSLRKTLPQ